jgi:AcrR family transcriptional regulator
MKPAPAGAERVLDTAATLFWKLGYAATTTREIAAAAGMQQASLYHHMASKEDLLFRISKSALEMFLSEVQTAAEAEKDAWKRARTLIRAHVVAILRYQQRNVTLLSEFRSLSRAHKMEIAELRARYSAFVRATFEAGQAQGRIRKDVPAKYLCLAMLNVLNWSALWYREDKDPAPEKVGDLMMRLFLEGVVTAKAPASSDEQPVLKARGRRTTKASMLDKLVEAAIGLFAVKGYAATSTREVASLLGIQKASLYYHIEGKEDLLYLICKASLEQIRSDVETALDGVEDPVERIRIVIVAHAESMLKNARRHQITFAEMHALQHDRLKEIVAMRAAYENVVRGVFQKAQKEGAVRTDVEARYIALAALGLLNRIPVWYKRAGPLAPHQLGHVFAAIFLGGVGARP